MINPRVTIAVPVYNLEQYVGETLDSLKAQTFTDFEVYIVNDGSTDGSEKAIEPYLSDPRFHYIYQENKGLAGARNTALKYAAGEWFAHLDSDDIWLPNCLEVLMKLADEDSNVNLLYGNTIRFLEDGTEYVMFNPADMQEGDLTLWLYEKNTLLPSVTMTKTEFIRSESGFNENLRYGEDYDLWLRLSRKGIRARAHKDPILRYRIRGQSLTSNRLINLERRVDILFTALEREDRPQYKTILQNTISIAKSEVDYEQARLAAIEGRDDVGMHLINSWRHRPNNVKRLAMGLLCYSSKLGISAGRDVVVKRLKSMTTDWVRPES